MRLRRRRNPVALALYVNAAVMALVAIAWLSRGDTPPLTPAAIAQALQHPPAQQPLAGGAGLFIVPGQFSANIWGLYLMDVDQQTICAYTVVGSPPQLKLIAARNFQNDRKLGNFNAGSPSPAEVKELVEKEQQRP